VSTQLQLNNDDDDDDDNNNNNNKRIPLDVLAFGGAFAKLQKATISFVISVCPSNI
jgi:hypothetical protein